MLFWEQNNNIFLLRLRSFPMFCNHTSTPKTRMYPPRQALHAMARYGLYCIAEVCVFSRDIRTFCIQWWKKMFLVLLGRPSLSDHWKSILLKDLELAITHRNQTIIFHLSPFFQYIGRKIRSFFLAHLV